MAAVIALPERMDISSCKDLLPQLVASRGQDLELDGNAVRHIGAVGAQLLLSANNSWMEDSATLTVTGLGDPATKCLSSLGVQLEQIGASSEGATS